MRPSHDRRTYITQIFFSWKDDRYFKTGPLCYWLQTGAYAQAFIVTDFGHVLVPEINTSKTYLILLFDGDDPGPIISVSFIDA